MNKYKIFKIINSQGVSVGKQDAYSSIAKAKCGAKHCRYRLDENSKIVEYEVTEIPISEISINVEISETQYGWNNKMVTGFGNMKFTKSSTQEPKPVDKIKFN